ncbi:MAG: hypothetical protein NVS1B11_24410 [Terriglobales bacterium]
MNCLLGRIPVAKVCLGTCGILNNNILDTILQAIGPGKHAFDAGRVGRDDANSSEARACGGNVFIHRVEPIARHLPGTRPLSASGKADARWRS